MRPEKEIDERIKIYEHLRKESKKLNYKLGAFWYQAKEEALLWVLGDDYSRLKFVEWEETYTTCPKCNLKFDATSHRNGWNAVKCPNCGEILLKDFTEEKKSNGG